MESTQTKSMSQNEKNWPKEELERIFELAKQDEKRSEKMHRIDESKLRQRITFPGFGN